MYENQTHDVILQRMLDRVSDKLDKREGSVIWDTHSPAALELQDLYIELERMIREGYGDTASREYLIKRCAERGITPYPATHAVLRGEFTPAAVDVTGQRFNIGEINYAVQEKTADEVYNVRCETAGAVGNRYLGAMTPIDYIDGLASAELTELLIPGEDEEETEHLRQRYFDSFDERAFGGNIRDYTEKTCALPGVGAVKVTRAWNSDIAPASLIPSVAVTAWYEAAAPELPEEVKGWLDNVYNAAAQKKLTVGGAVLLTIIDSEYGAAGDTLIKAVQEAIDPPGYEGEGYGLAPIGHVVTVRSAETVNVDIRTNISFAEGYSRFNMQESIEAAIGEYLAELRRSWDKENSIFVRISQIETRLLALDGIIDIQDTEINGRAENLVLGMYEIPILGVFAFDGAASVPRLGQTPAASCRGEVEEC